MALKLSSSREVAGRDKNNMYRVGIAQTHNTYDYRQNLESICRAIEVHSKAKSDIILFPECVTTGYNRGLLSINEPQLMESIYIVMAKALKYQIAIALPTPWPRGDGKFFNSLLFISEAGKAIKRIDKACFQNGEEKLFVPGERQDRVFIHNEYRVGTLVCIETAKGPWDLLKRENACDLILWPGFYATTRGEDWESASAPDDLLVKANIKEWKCPLVQVTCASSPESAHWPDKEFGGSLVIDARGQSVFCAKSNQEHMAVATFERKELLGVETI